MSTGAAAMQLHCASIYVTLFVTGQCKWRTSQWASSIFDSFPRIDKFYRKRTLRCNKKPETFKYARKTRRFKPSNAAKTKTCMSNSGAHFKIPKWWDSTRNEKWIWMTYSDFSAWDVGRSSSLNSTSILDVTQARGYFPESRLTYRDLEYVSRVSLMIHWLQLGYRMNRPGCSTVWLNPN